MIEHIPEFFILFFDIPDEFMNWLERVSLGLDLSISFFILEFPLLALFVDYIFILLKQWFFGPLISFDLPAIGTTGLIWKWRLLVSILCIKFLLWLINPVLVFWSDVVQFLINFCLNDGFSFKQPLSAGCIMCCPKVRTASLVAGLRRYHLSFIPCNLLLVVVPDSISLSLTLPL